MRLLMNIRHSMMTIFTIFFCIIFVLSSPFRLLCCRRWLSQSLQWTASRVRHPLLAAYTSSSPSSVSTTCRYIQRRSGPNDRSTLHEDCHGYIPIHPSIYHHHIIITIQSYHHQQTKLTFFVCSGSERGLLEEATHVAVERRSQRGAASREEQEAVCLRHRPTYVTLPLGSFISTVAALLMREACLDAERPVTMRYHRSKWRRRCGECCAITCMATIRVLTCGVDPDNCCCFRSYRCRRAARRCLACAYSINYCCCCRC